MAELEFVAILQMLFRGWLGGDQANESKYEGDFVSSS